MRSPARLRTASHQVVLGVLLVALFALALRLDPAFVTRGVQLELSTHAVELALLSLPMTLIMISGGIDLSIGSIMALAAVVLGLLFEAGAPMWVAAGAAVAAGGAAGAVNGVFVAFVRVHPLIVTLASLALYRGLAEGISQGRPISGFSAGYLRLGNALVSGVPVSVLLVLAAAGATALLKARTVDGFRIQAIGDNERAARYAGIPVDRVKCALYTMSGVAGGIAAVLFVARRNTAKADLGLGIELEVITAVVLGGTSITGGRGSVLGTILGVALIHEVREFVSWHWEQDELILMVIGGILIGSVLLNTLASKGRPRLSGVAR
jgi:rhamnose transport system permease protein